MLGIVSDSHGQQARLARALRLLQTAGATRFVHCGDLGGEAILDTLAPYPTTFVWGNTDLPDAGLIRYARQIGLQVPDAPPGRLTFGGQRIAVFHGHEPSFNRLLRFSEYDLEAFAIQSACDYLLYGHTHRAADQRVGSVRMINPGALHRAATYTVALLDPGQDLLTHFAVPETDDGPLTPYQCR